MSPGRARRTVFRLIGPAALALAAVLGSSWWLPGFSSLPQILVAVALAFVLALSTLDLRLGGAAAALLLILCSLLFAPELHLWGDGALRLRNLASNQSVPSSGAYEPGDTCLRTLLVDLGLRPEGSFALVGAAAGVIYVLSCCVFASSLSSKTSPWVMTLLLTPTWTVFFTGYVESYAPLAALSMLSLALICKGSSPWGASIAASLAAVFHVLGIVLFPGLIVYALRRRKPRALAPPALVLASLFAWLALCKGTAGPSLSLGPNDPLLILKTVIFAAPAILALVTCIGRKPRLALLPPAAVGLMLIFLLPMERGPSRDWDLIAVMLLPTYVLLLGTVKLRSTVLAPAAIASIVAAGPAIGSFLDTKASFARFEDTLREDPNAGAFEEAAIYQRDEGRPDLAAELFGRAFRYSGNGRHLAQASEALRLDGRLDEALSAAQAAVELRPSLDVVWTQLAMAARDAGDAREAVRAAAAIEELDGAGLWGWSVALETSLAAEDTRLALLSADRALRSGGDGDYDVLVNAALAARLARSEDLAERRLRRAVEMDPLRPLARFDLALLLAQTGDSVAAESVLVHLLQDHPRHDQGQMLLRSLRGP